VRASLRWRAPRSRRERPVEPTPLHGSINGGFPSATHPWPPQASATLARHHARPRPRAWTASLLAGLLMDLVRTQADAVTAEPDGSRSA
jgi:hypothetical protein